VHPEWTVPVRWRAGEPRRCRALPPLSAEHPAASWTCPICRRAIGTVAAVQLVVVEPAAAASTWGTVCALVAHEACVAPLTDDELALLAAS
jgi:hypothetical protein